MSATISDAIAHLGILQRFAFNQYWDFSLYGIDSFAAFYTDQRILNAEKLGNSLYLTARVEWLINEKIDRPNLSLFSSKEDIFNIQLLWVLSKVH